MTPTCRRLRLRSSREAPDVPAAPGVRGRRGGWTPESPRPGQVRGKEGAGGVGRWAGNRRGSNGELLHGAALLPLQPPELGKTPPSEVWEIGQVRRRRGTPPSPERSASRGSRLRGRGAWARPPDWVRPRSTSFVSAPEAAFPAQVFSAVMDSGPRQEQVCSGAPKAGSACVYTGNMERRSSYCHIQHYSSSYRVCP